MIFNKDVILEAIGGDHTIYNLLIQEYLNSHNEQKEKIITALNTNDCKKIHIEVHSLKGIFETYGVEPYVPLIKKVVQAAKEDNLEYIKNHIEQIIEAMDILQNDFKKEITII